MSFSQLINEVQTKSRFTQLRIQLPSTKVAWFKDPLRDEEMRVEFSEERLEYLIIDTKNNQLLMSWVTNYDHFVGTMLERI